MSACMDARNAITIAEVPCPHCGEPVEIFDRDGKYAVNSVCDNCGFVFQAGEPSTLHNPGIPYLKGN